MTTHKKISNKMKTNKLDFSKVVAKIYKHGQTAIGDESRPYLSAGALTGIYLISRKAGKKVFVEHDELEAQIIQAVGQLMEVNTKEAIEMMTQAEESFNNP